MAAKNPILILAFIYFANFFLSLLQLQVVIIIQVFVDGFSSIQMALARFRSFQVVLGRFRSFQQLVPHFSTLASTVRSNCSYNLRLSHELRDKNLSYSSKVIRKFVLQVALKFLLNISCFDEEARRCAFHFVEKFSKNE